MRSVNDAPSTPGTEVVDLGDYVGLLRRRFWLIVLVTLITIGLAAVYSFTRTPSYTALTKVLVQPASPSTQFRPDQLVSLDTEASLVASAPVAEIALEELGWSLTVPELLKKVEVQTQPETLVLDITFTDEDAAQAAMGADAFARAYLQYKQERAAEATRIATEAVEEDIAENLEKRDEIDGQLEDLNPGSGDYRELQQERDVLSGRIATLRAQLTEVPAVTDPGEIILPATPPASPSSPKHGLDLALGAVLGLFFGVVAAFIRDRTDERVAGRADMERTLHVPLLAVIPHMQTRGKREDATLVTDQQSRSPAAEAYRTLRTAVMAAARQSGATVLAVTSPGVGDGKTTTTANLAAALSHAGNRVLAISADLRRPSLHRAFSLDNRLGLSDVLLGASSTKGAIQEVSSTLDVLTSGQAPQQPAELLQSPKMRKVLDKQRERYDFVLIDCPPTLGLADTLAVAPSTDGVLMVARAETTKRGVLAQAGQQLGQVGAVLRGTVLNDVALSRRTLNDEYRYGHDSDPSDPRPAS